MIHKLVPMLAPAVLMTAGVLFAPADPTPGCPSTGGSGPDCPWQHPEPWQTNTPTLDPVPPWARGERDGENSIAFKLDPNCPPGAPWSPTNNECTPNDQRSPGEWSTPTPSELPFKPSGFKSACAYTPGGLRGEPNEPAPVPCDDANPQPTTLPNYMDVPGVGKFGLNAYKLDPDCPWITTSSGQCVGPRNEVCTEGQACDNCAAGKCVYTPTPTPALPSSWRRTPYCPGGAGCPDPNQPQPPITLNPDDLPTFDPRHDPNQWPTTPPNAPVAFMKPSNIVICDEVPLPVGIKWYCHELGPNGEVLPSYVSPNDMSGGTPFADVPTTTENPNHTESGGF